MCCQKHTTTHARPTIVLRNQLRQSNDQKLCWLSDLNGNSRLLLLLFFFVRSITCVMLAYYLSIIYVAIQNCADTGFELWLKSKEKKVHWVLFKHMANIMKLSENFTKFQKIIRPFEQNMWNGFNFIFYARALFFNRRGKSEWSLKMCSMQTAKSTI